MRTAVNKYKDVQGMLVFKVLMFLALCAVMVVLGISTGVRLR